MKKKSDRKRLEKKADELWSKCIRTRDRKCQNPGCNSDYLLDAHHIAGRIYKPTRHLLANGVTLCKKCHFPEKVRPEEFRSMVIGIVGESHFANMYDLAKGNGSPHKVTIADLQFEIESLTRELKRLESDWGRIGTNQ
jgi:hypothetical protein